MCLLSRLLVVLVVCLVAMALPAKPAQADGGGPYITLDPDNGVPGIYITVRGGNFTPDILVYIYYYFNSDRTRVVNVNTDEDGNFDEETFLIPESYRGAHEVRAYIGTSLQATANFTVKPGLTVSPEEGLVGTNVTVQGHGFAEDEKDIELRYYLNSSNYTLIAATIEANEYGWWEQSFVIPPSTKGIHKIDAKGANSTLTMVKDATFEVTSVNNPPNIPSYPSPSDHATGVPLNADLSWTGGDPDAGDTVTYDVYFGNNSTPPLRETIGPYPATQLPITYDPGTLVNDVTYFWKIVARDNHGVTGEGPLWDFTTAHEEEVLGMPIWFWIIVAAGAGLLAGFIVGMRRGRAAKS